MDWNVVVSIYQDGFRRTQRALAKLGRVEPSAYYNVLLVSADDPLALISAIERQTEEDPALYDAIARIAPAMRHFEFHSVDELRQQATSILREWAPQLAGRSFHVRLHRRGAKHDLHAHDMERFLDDAVTEASSLTGPPARISFVDPDAVIAIDTIDDRAGISLWTREDLVRHRLLRPD